MGYYRLKPQTDLLNNTDLFITELKQNNESQQDKVALLNTLSH